MGRGWLSVADGDRAFGPLAVISLRSMRVDASLTVLRGVRNGTNSPQPLGGWRSVVICGVMRGLITTVSAHLGVLGSSSRFWAGFDQICRAGAPAAPD